MLQLHVCTPTGKPIIVINIHVRTDTLHNFGYTILFIQACICLRVLAHVHACVNVRVCVCVRACMRACVRA